MTDEEPFARGIGLDDVQRALEDDVEVDPLVALVEEHLAGADLTTGAVVHHPMELGLGQPGKHLRAALHRDRRLDHAASVHRAVARRKPI